MLAVSCCSGTGTNRHVPSLVSVGLTPEGYPRDQQNHCPSARRIETILGSGKVEYILALLVCGVLLVHTVGIGQDYLRRRDTKVVASLSSNPGTPLLKISAATGLKQGSVASSLQRLAADGLVVTDSGTSPLTRSYRLAR
ncbi:winged helix-turn-helix domain-containing protein [Streptomyces bauhiniae]|uniref:Winged helix-turn-helix domain-containing protein n=1 Tax=Streptomyces bauhiniae TaxID=2340725 RepID=A0A7K3QWR9_9ACTN|nr:winged helix-turn-helix domain-containing protein [Streptomyces bauhiniae]NEB94352.1 winged helix-turn-helix domain-containing protein [Streptomyces bauhiniae]